MTDNQSTDALDRDKLAVARLWLTLPADPDTSPRIMYMGETLTAGFRDGCFVVDATTPDQREAWRLAHATRPTDAP